MKPPALPSPPAARVRWPAWLGLLLMISSFAWLTLMPRAARPVAEKRLEPGNGFSHVIIDAGHGGDDSGAMHGGISEKDLTLDVAQRLKRILQARGFTTVMTRDDDTRVSLATRAALANRERDCIFVSIHFDEGARASATGVQTFYAERQVKDSLAARWLPFLQMAVSPAPDERSQSLAACVQNSLVSGTQAVNRGTRAQQFYVVSNVRHPAVLVEGGFLSNAGDMSKLTTASYRERLARAIADGILQYRAVAQPAVILALGTTE